MKIKHLLLFCALVGAMILPAGCTEKITSLNAYGRFISDPANGCKISRSVNGVLVSVIYLPPEYNSLKQLNSMHSNDRSTYDSLLAINKCTPVFMMVFAPDEAKGNKNDIMYDGLSNFKEYTQRALALNFELEHHVQLLINGESYAPVLSSLENTYGLTKDRKVNMVFAPKHHQEEFDKAAGFDFVYTDETFGVGTLHFYFDKKNIIAAMPEIL